MRFTKALFKQHLGWHSKMKWRTQRRRVIFNDNTVDNLKEIGLPVIDPIQEFMQKPTLVNQFIYSVYIHTIQYNKMSPLFRFEHVDANAVPIEKNNIEINPNWNERVCHVFKDANVLIYGQKQAQKLTKTLLVNELPENVQKLAKDAKITDETDIQLKNSILQAHLFDAHQEKLAKRKNPEKPMWVFPRMYGITDLRKK